MARRPVQDRRPKRLQAMFYASPGGNEPVKDFLLELNAEDRKLIGLDIATVEYGWPVGMPTCGSMGDGLWEVRTKISDRRIARVLFFVKRGRMYLLHGFIKKTQKTPKDDLDLAKARRWEIEDGE
jgi:phage-related protein